MGVGTARRLAASLNTVQERTRRIRGQIRKLFVQWAAEAGVIRTPGELEKGRVHVAHEVLLAFRDRGRNHGSAKDRHTGGVELTLLAVAARPRSDPRNSRRCVTLFRHVNLPVLVSLADI